jgi:hypothetical protein
MSPPHPILYGFLGSCPMLQAGAKSQIFIVFDWTLQCLFVPLLSVAFILETRNVLLSRVSRTKDPIHVRAKSSSLVRQEIERNMTAIIRISGRIFCFEFIDPRRFTDCSNSEIVML